MAVEGWGCRVGQMCVWGEEGGEEWGGKREGTNNVLESIWRGSLLKGLFLHLKCA